MTLSLSGQENGRGPHPMKLSNPPEAGLRLWLWEETSIPQLLLPGRKNRYGVPIPRKMQTPIGPVNCPIFPAEKAGSLTLWLWEELGICGTLTIWAARRLWEKGRLPKSVLSGRQNTGMLLSERYKCPFGPMSIPIPPAGREARPRESRGTRHQLPPLSKWPPQKDTVAKRDLPPMWGKVKINSLEYPL